MKKHTTTIIFSTLLIILDQISKYFFYDKNLLSNREIIQSAFNTGISRSLPIPKLVTIVLTFFIIGAVIYYYHKKQISKRATIFIVWWAIWNLIDRIFLWWVRDFILAFKRFPIFNLADIFINIWLVLIVLKEFFGFWQKFSWKTKNY
jgi:lipoprotein signal peptidase